MRDAYFFVVSLILTLIVLIIMPDGASRILYDVLAVAVTLTILFATLAGVAAAFRDSSTKGKE